MFDGLNLKEAFFEYLLPCYLLVVTVIIGMASAIFAVMGLVALAKYLF